MKTIIASPDAPKAVGPYSQAVLAGGTLYVSGQLPINPLTATMPDGIAAQTARSLDNIGAILHQAGFDYADVVKSTVLLTDMADFAAMNEVYASYYAKDMPARVCYAVAALPMGAKVEIDVIAVK